MMLKQNFGPQVKEGTAIPFFTYRPAAVWD